MISLCVRYVALIFVVVFTEFTSTEREHLSFCLGKYEKDSIVKDCVEVSSLFKDIETLKKINVDVYIKNRNKVILAFLNGISYGEQEMKKQLTLKTCVASIWNEYKVFCRTHVFCEQYHAMSSNSKSHVHKSKW